jgi:GDP-L-fucose synthase
MNKQDRVYVAGHRGLVGSAIVRALEKRNFNNILVCTHDELDLTYQTAVYDFFSSEQPEFVFMAAAKVGGILANDTYPADFIRDNLIIQTNVIDAAYKAGVNKLVFLGSSCIYPKFAVQPMKEDSLLTGPLEPTNQWYAIAKIAGIKMCQAYRKQYGFNAICLLPTNLYGPGDNFDLSHSHVLPALIRKFHEAKQSHQDQVIVWGTGKPKREFLYVDDLAEASVQLMQTYDSSDIVNVGVGKDISIAELAELVKDVIGYEGEVIFDSSKPDGTPQKLLDISRLNTVGWKANISLKEGIKLTYQWFCKNVHELRE